MPIDRRSRLGPDSQIRKDLDAPNNAGPYIGIVKEISDPQRMGTVLVYIAFIPLPVFVISCWGHLLSLRPVLN